MEISNLFQALESYEKAQKINYRELRLLLIKVNVLNDPLSRRVKQSAAYRELVRNVVAPGCDAGKDLNLCVCLSNEILTITLDHF